MKKLLSLALALVLCLGLAVPALAAADEKVTAIGENGSPLDIQGVVRISHAVSKETMQCEGQTIDVYTVYPGTKLWKLGFQDSGYANILGHEATLENNTLQLGQQSIDFSPNDPTYYCWITFDEKNVGDIHVIDVTDQHYRARVGIRVVAGEYPASAPVTYIGELGLSQEVTGKGAQVELCEEGEYNHHLTPLLVPAGTVITMGNGGWAYSWPIGSVYDTSVGGIVPDVYNGKKAIVVEPGRLYNIDMAMYAGSFGAFLPRCEYCFMVDDGTSTVAEGTLGAGDQYTWTIAANGTLNVDGTGAAAGDKFFAACWDAGGAFLGVKIISATAGNLSAKLDSNWARVKLIWANGQQAPQCAAAEAIKQVH